MKALTNILTQLLMLLLLMLVACTEDTAEVDNLVRGEEYVQVRMQVPGMKAAATRADEAEDNLTSVWALVFRDGKLVSKTEVTTASTLIPSTSTTGTFNIPRPKSGDVIHFLANLPEGYDLSSVDEMSDLTSLTTDNPSQLSYWGMATYESGESLSVTLYRNMAKIEIAPDPNECTFPEDQLFIVGLFNANQSGALVPYNGSFNFDLTTNDYFTLPADVEKETDGDAQPVTSLYVFEHDNPDAYTEANKDNFFCVICQIGKDYYKVALTSDDERPYDIIRNHRYVIYVKDLDEGAADYPTALTADPINLEIKVEKEVALQLIQEGIDENGDELKIQQGNIAINSHANSTEEVTIKVVVPAGVKTLTVQAEGFTVTSGDAGDGREMTSDGNNQYTIKEAYRNQENIVRFKLKLNNDVDAETETTITVSGEGEDQYTTVTANASTTITVTPAGETEGTIWWQGLMILDAMDDETKIAIPKSYFFNGETPLIPVGSQIVFDFENVTGFLSDTDDDYLRIWMQAADPNDWSQVATQDFVYDDNRATLNVTQEVLDDILDTSDGEYANDNALIIQGQGRILKKITLIPAKERIDAEPDKTQLYYDSDDTQVVTVNVTVPDGVGTLTIDGASNFTVKQGDEPLTATDTEGVYSYTVTDNSNPIPFVFTLSQNVTETQTITFSDPSESVNGDEVQITMAATPTVTFGYQNDQIINLTGGCLDVQMNGNNVPDGKEVTLTIIAQDFTVTAQNGTELTQNGNEWTYQGTLTTLRFTPTSEGDNKSISISGGGVDVNVTSADITVTVKDAVSEISATSGTIDMDSGQPSTTITLTKPSSVSNVSVNITDANGTNVNSKFSITINGYEILPDNGNLTFSNGDESVGLVFNVKDANIASGSYSVTFADQYNNQIKSYTTTITITNTPSLTISPTSAILNLNDDTPKFEVTATVPQGSILASLVIAAPEYITIKQSGTTLGAGEVTYSTQINGGNSVTFTFELAEGATIPNGVNSFNVNFTGSGTNLKVNSSVNVSVSNETTSSVNLEITSPSQAHATIDLGSYNSWEEKSITMQLRIPAGVKQVTFGGESINNFTISTYSGNFNNNVYTNSNSSSSQEVTFTVKIGDNASLGEHIINISGTGDGITVNGTQLVVTLTQTAFGVTPATATISNTNKSVEITIVKPKVLTQFSFVISDNDKLKATGNNMQFNDHALVYYFYQSQNTMEEVITVALNDGVTITEEGTCTITFYDNTNQTQNANTKTVTITLQP